MSTSEVDKLIERYEDKMEHAWEEWQLGLRDGMRLLADLIDPTCHVELKRVVVDEHYRHTRIIPTCSVCGSPLDGGIGFPRYCQGCGARMAGRWNDGGSDEQA